MDADSSSGWGITRNGQSVTSFQNGLMAACAIDNQAVGALNI